MQANCVSTFGTGLYIFMASSLPRSVQRHTIGQQYRPFINYQEEYFMNLIFYEFRQMFFLFFLPVIVVFLHAQPPNLPGRLQTRLK